MPDSDISDTFHECDGCFDTFSYYDCDKKGGICCECMRCCDCGCKCNDDSDLESDDGSEDETTEVCPTYSEFTEMFDVSDRFDGYKCDADNETDAFIQILWKPTRCKSNDRENGGWCAILWKPSSEVWETEGDGRWIRTEYESSSNFGSWWAQMTG